MGFLKKYAIHLQSLSTGEHIFEYDINNAFFENFELSEIHEANAKAIVTIHKTNTVSTLQLKLTGFTALPCDRCLENIEIPVDGVFDFTIKENAEEEDLDNDNIIAISKSDMDLNVANMIYENVHLLLPLLRSNCVDSKGIKRCNEETISKLEQLTVKEIDNSDPRWDALKKLKNNNN